MPAFEPSWTLDDARPALPRRMLDAAWRLGLWLAYRGLRIWWWLRRPEAHGAAVAILIGNAILLVRHSYKPGLDLPGGGIGRRETPEAAAVRELDEELGLEVPPAELESLGIWHHAAHCRPIVDTLFLWQPAELPRLRIDRREIVAAGFARLEELDTSLLGNLPRLLREAELLRPRACHVAAG